MLFLTTVSKWGGIGRGSHIIDKRIGTPYVFSVKNVYNLKQDGTGSKFLYAVNTTDRKTGLDEIFCNTAHTTIREEYDVEPLSSIITLSVFPSNNLAKTPETIYVNINDFAYAWAHNPYPQYSWLVYCMKGGREKIVLVDMTLVDIVTLDNQFDENNVQWFWFVDPTEEIFPNKFIRVA